MHVVLHEGSFNDRSMVDVTVTHTANNNESTSDIIMVYLVHAYSSSYSDSESSLWGIRALRSTSFCMHQVMA